jgi:hypothetical protein
VRGLRVGESADLVGASQVERVDACLTLGAQRTPRINLGSIGALIVGRRIRRLRLSCLKHRTHLLIAKLARHCRRGRRRRA